MIVIACGMESEAATIPEHPRLFVVHGTVGFTALSNLNPNDVEAVISWGVCGSLTPDVLIGDIFISDEIIFPVSGGTSAQYSNLDLSLDFVDIIRPVFKDRVKHGTTYSDKALIAFNPAARALLNQKTGAKTVDQLSYFVSSWAHYHNKPYVNVGSPSDGWNQKITTDPRLINPGGSASISEALLDIVKEPSDLALMVKEAWTCECALHSLSIAAHALKNSNWGLK